MNRKKLGIVSILFSIILIAAVILIVIQIQRSTAPTDTSAATVNGLNLVQISPAPETRVNVGDRVKLSVRTDIRGSDPVTAATVVLKFDAAALESISITEQGDLLGLGKQRDNSGGIARIDVAGSTTFSSGQSIVEAEFQVRSIASGSTTIRVDSSSVLLSSGNTLSQSLLGSVTIPFLVTQASSSTSSVTQHTVSTSTPSSSSSSSSTPAQSSSTSSKPALSSSSSSQPSFPSSSTNSNPPVAQSSSSSSTFSTETFSTDTFSTESTSSESSFFSESSFDSTTSSSTSLTSITTTDPGDEYILTPGANQEIIPGVDSRVVIYGLFGVSAVAGVTAAYLFFRREEPSDVF